MKKTNKYKKLVLKHFLTLEHFIEQGAWPIFASDKEIKETCKDIKEFEVNEKGRLALNKPLPNELLTEYYKYRLEEVKREYDDLYFKIKQLVD